MKLHSNTIRYADVVESMRRAKNAGLVSQDVFFVKCDHAGSRSRAFAFEIQLGAMDQRSGPTNSRHYKNTGHSGAGYGDEKIWAASYDEWGWYIAELFAIDPDAVFGTYKGRDSFNAQTGGKFATVAARGLLRLGERP